MIISTTRINKRYWQRGSFDPIDLGNLSLKHLALMQPRLQRQGGVLNRATVVSETYSQTPNPIRSCELSTMRDLFVLILQSFYLSVLRHLAFSARIRRRVLPHMVKLAHQ